MKKGKKVFLILFPVIALSTSLLPIFPGKIDSEPLFVAYLVIFEEFKNGFEDIAPPYSFFTIAVLIILVQIALNVAIGSLLWRKLVGDSHTHPKGTGIPR